MSRLVLPLSIHHDSTSVSRGLRAADASREVGPASPSRCTAAAKSSAQACAAQPPRNQGSARKRQCAQPACQSVIDAGHDGRIAPRVEEFGDPLLRLSRDSGDSFKCIDQ